MFDIAIESMSAQIQSKFGTELDKLWQQVIDYRDTELRDLTEHQNRFRRIREYFDKNISQRFMDLVWRYVGIHIDSIKYTELWDAGFCTVMFIGGNNDQNGTVQIQNVLNGNYLDRYWSGQVKETLDSDTLFQLASSYDKMTGCIKEQQREEVRKLVSCAMGFDLGTGFLLQDYIPSNSGVENFTAREITAVVLHELGHTVCLIDHAADMYARSASFDYLMGAFKSTHVGDEDAAIRFATNLITTLEEKGKPNVADQVRKVTNKFAANLGEAGATANATAKKTLIAGFINGLGGFARDLLIVPMDMVVGNDSRLRFSSSDQKKKYGDLPCNARMLTWEERKADEFAVSHGYGADQVAALDKMSAMWCRLGKSSDQVERIRNMEKLGKGISILDKMRILINAPIYCGDPDDMFYPAGSKRFKEMLNLIIQNMKANNADPEFIQKSVKDIEFIKNKIEKCNQYDEFIAKAVRGYELFTKYATIPSFFDMLVHGRVQRELETLIDEVQSLSGNLLHFYGTKLKTLANKGN